MKKKMLLKHQGQFIQSPFLFLKMRFHILVAGYGAGKTSSISSAVIHCVKLLQGKYDTEGHSPAIGLGGVSFAHLEKTTVAMIKEDLDASKTPYNHNTKLNTITIGNVKIILVSLSEPGKIVGFNCWCFFGDEVDDLGTSGSDDLTFEAIKAMNERTRQIITGMRKPFLCFGSTSQGQKGLYRVYTQFIKTGVAFNLIRGSTRDNPYLDPEYVDSLYRMYNETERKVFLEGFFLPISTGRVIGDFDWGRNFVNVDMDQEIDPDETVYWSQDFNTGYFRGCVAVERSGRIYIVKGYDFPDIRDAPAVVRHDFPHNKIVWIPDTTAKDQITHFIKELRKHRIHWIQRGKNPLVEDSAFLVNKLLYTKRLFLTNMAKEVAEALALAQRDKNGKIPKGVGPNSPIHYCFPGYTKVTTARGQVRIDKVRVGDMVLTRLGWKKVEATAYMGRQRTMNVGLTRATPEHPFWTTDRGMTPAAALKDGDTLAMLFEDNVVVSVHAGTVDMHQSNNATRLGINTGARRLRNFFAGTLRIKERVYDISVEGAHEFFADGILVSNCDAVRMVCYFLASNKRSLRDIKRVTIARHLEMYEEEPAITELDGGYRELNPQAL